MVQKGHKNKGKHSWGALDLESGVSFPWKPSTLRLEFPGIPPTIFLLSFMPWLPACFSQLLP